MLYVFHGNDRVKVKGKARELASALLRKKPDATIFELTPESWNPDTFQEYSSGQGLFERKYIVLMHDLLSTTATKESFADRLKEMKLSDNVFILTEGELLKKDQTLLEKHAEKLQVFETAKAAAKKEFNIFALTDAVGRRDPLTSWVIFTQALMAGVEIEQIHGIIVWHFKSLALAATSADAKASGLNPFVYSKAIASAKKFSHYEITTFFNTLSTIYHEARRGRTDLTLATESFLLDLTATH